MAPRLVTKVRAPHECLDRDSVETLSLEERTPTER